MNGPIRGPLQRRPDVGGSAYVVDDRDPLLALIALGARLLYDLSRQRAALVVLAYYLVTLTASAAFSIAGRWAVESA